MGACVLAWWQWDRYQSASGTLQNLGYVLQWPLFGLFPAFMFYRIRKSARTEVAETVGDVGGTVDGEVEAGNGSGPVVAAPVRSRLAYVPRERAPDAADGAELTAYNRYLAQLNSQEDS